MYVCACACVSPRSVCIWKGGVNLLDICFSCPEVIECHACKRMCVCDKQHTHFLCFAERQES